MTTPQIKILKKWIKSHTREEGGAHLRISFWHLLMKFEKPKKSECWKKWKKIAGDIIILHVCTKNHNHMRYSSWDMEWENFFCHFGPFFALYPPPSLKTQKTKILKNWKSIWRCHHFKLVQQKTWSNDVCLLKYGVQQT